MKLATGYRVLKGKNQSGEFLSMFEKFGTFDKRKSLSKVTIGLGLLVGLMVLLAACGDNSAPIENVAFPLPTVTPLPGMTDPPVDTAPSTTSSQPAAVNEPAPAAKPAQPPQTQPSPVAQPVNAKPPAKPQAVGKLPVVEGNIEAVTVENNQSVLTVNQTRYTIIPEITRKIGKWFKVGNHIKMTGTQYSDGTNLITLVVNVTAP